MNHTIGIGDHVPDVVLNEGTESLRLHQLKGQALLLSFSSWDWNPDQDLQLSIYDEVMTSIFGDEARILSFARRGPHCDLGLAGERIQFPCFESRHFSEQAAEAFGVPRKEAIFVVDADGIVRWSYIGPQGVPPSPQYLQDAWRNLKKSWESSEPSEVSRRCFLLSGLAIATLASFGVSESAAAKAKVSAKGELLPIKLKVNGGTHQLKIDPRVTLLDALRDHLNLTGSKKGCDHGQCGACTVVVDGRRINSCLALAIMQEGKEIVTIEGLAEEDKLHPLQTAFVKHDGFQCGYCTPGQIMSAYGLLTEPCGQSDPEVREAMSGNICRCGCYSNIVAAIQEVRKGRV